MGTAGFACLTQKPMSVEGRGTPHKKMLFKTHFDGTNCDFQSANSWRFDFVDLQKEESRVREFV